MSRRIRTELVGLLPGVRRRLPKPRAGFLAWARPLINLYEANESELRVRGTTPAAMSAQLRRYEALLDQESALRKQLQLVEDTRVLYGAQLWTSMLDIYARAKSAARNSSVIRVALGGFKRLMRAPRKQKPSSGRQGGDEA